MDDEVQGVVQDFDGTPIQFLNIRILHEGCLSYTVTVIDCYRTIVYKINSRTNSVCTCGAKHTSNPNYHLDYCSLSEEGE